MLDGLREKLMAAASQGIISAEQADRLSLFLEASPHGATTGLDALRDLEPASPVEESEMPRFVRGFHDVLITIGVVILLTGLSGLLHVAFALLACVALAEVLVKRQRLALPAAALTIAYAISATWLLIDISSYVFWKEATPEIGTGGVLLLGYLLLMIPFYWRYQVPLALATLIVSVAGASTILILAVIERAAYRSEIGVNHPILYSAIGLVAALIVFGIALRFDLADPARVTRRSDVAFWLHLATAPALLYSTLALLFFLRAGDQDWDVGAVSASQPFSVILVVSLFVLIGLVMDRRAFVTSGLISLGVALGALIKDQSFDWNINFSLVLATMGVVVLFIGVFWPTLRGLVVRLLPNRIQSRLPPLRA